MVKSKQRGFSPCNGPRGFTDLGPEIVTDILSRLPIESILRCRSVCKNWYSLIQDPEFINLHLCRTYNQPYRFIVKEIWNDTSNVFLLDLEECKAREIFRNNLWSHVLRIMCSCNGLLCVALTVAYNPVYICNPITRESIMLPLSKSKPSKCTVVGLGVDTSSGKYKAVRTYEADDDGGMGFEVITFGESSWREVTAPQGLDHKEIHSSVFWNGTLYWIVNDLVGIFNKCILAFGLSLENFQIFCFADGLMLPTTYARFELLDLRGCLTLVEHHTDSMRMSEVRGNKVGDRDSCLAFTA